MRASPLLFALALSPIFALPALAAPPHPMPHPEDRLAWDKKDCSEITPREAARLAYLDAKLGLKDAQRPAFATWRQARLDAVSKEQAACLETAPKTVAPLSTPDHEALVESALTRKLQTLQSTRPALLGLYEVLTPEQRVIFDSKRLAHGKKGHEKP